MLRATDLASVKQAFLAWLAGQQRAAQRHVLAALVGNKESIVAQPPGARRKHVQQEAANELLWPMGDDGAHAK